uniref:Serine protease n=1 Tax=Fibrocapsa japonica TaxID=94617 RepID=A0A7S2V3G8_9STRA|mmetsp:Transcript_5320/g.8073  ORF Transcript_5320/g.8073 Transcript_5320/m.8073 type:complete len:253 (+) Transcript_5320:176-934(+)
MGTYLCTGFLITSEGHLMTNAHCISSEEEALNTDYEFYGWTPGCEEANYQLKTRGDIYKATELLGYDNALDYAIVNINLDDATKAELGYMELHDLAYETDDGAFMNQIQGMAIYLAHHSLGKDMMFGLFSTHEEDLALETDANLESYSGRARGHVIGFYEALCTTKFAKSGYYEVGYYIDTEGGSSGCFVASADNHKVVGLNHCGCTGCACMNIAVPINHIYQHMCQDSTMCTVMNCCESTSVCHGNGKKAC